MPDTEVGIESVSKEDQCYLLAIHVLSNGDHNIPVPAKEVLSLMDAMRTIHNNNLDAILSDFKQKIESVQE